MMNTLLLRLAGPMQSWGTQSRFTVRDTGMEPSKSGVIGLLCAALGRARAESLDDLAALRMGVRVDFPGEMSLDYQTAGGGRLPSGHPYGVRRASGGSGDTVLSNRYYLTDADFLVGIESEDIDQLRCLDDALRNPVWQLCLGRKAFIPGVPVYVPEGLREREHLEDALTKHPWPRWDVDVPVIRDRPAMLRFSIEDISGEDVRMDQPTGASFQTRRFLPRRVKNHFRRLGTGDRDVPVRLDTEEDANVLVTTRT